MAGGLDINQSVKILAVDDEEFSRAFLGRVLKSIGFTNTVYAENGDDAFEILETSRADANSPIRLIICDIEMPGMNGYEFVRRLRYGEVEIYKNTPVIMLTGKDSDKNVRSARIHKISGFLVKPPSAHTLRIQIDQALADQN